METQSRYPLIYTGDFVVQVWTDKHTCYFAYHKNPTRPNGEHVVHDTMEAALVDAKRQAGIE